MLNNNFLIFSLSVLLFLASSFGCSSVSNKSEYQFVDERLSDIQDSVVIDNISDIESLLSWLDTEMNIAKKEGQVGRLQILLSEAFNLSIYIGDIELAETFLVEARLLNHTITDNNFEASILTFYSILELKRNKLLKSYDYLKEAFKLYGSNDIDEINVFSFIQLYRILLILNQFEYARTVLNQSYSLIGDNYALNEYLNFLHLDLLIESRQIQQAKDYLQNSITPNLQENSNNQDLTDKELVSSILIYWQLDDTVSVKNYLSEYFSSLQGRGYENNDPTLNLILSDVLIQSDPDSSMKLFIKTSELSYYGNHSYLTSIYRSYDRSAYYSLTGNVWLKYYSALIKYNTHIRSYKVEKDLINISLATGDIDIFLPFFKTKEKREFLIGPIVYSSISVFVMLFIYLFFRWFTKNMQLNKVDKPSVTIPQPKIHFELSNREKDVVQSKVEGKINDTDWDIIDLLLINSLMSNTEISNNVKVGIHGVNSSLRKLYLIFEIEERTGKKSILKKKIIHLIKDRATL